MENENLNTSAELEQMRKEYDLLKNKFAQQSIVNERLLKESMKRKLTWLDKEEREEYIYAGVAIALSPSFHLAFNASGWFIAFTVLLMLFCAFMNWWMHRNVHARHIEQQDLLTVAKNVKQLRKGYVDWLKWSLPLLVVWAGWLAYEVVRNLDRDPWPMMIGLGIGVAFGMLIGLRYRSKAIKTCDELIKQIEE